MVLRILAAAVLALPATLAAQQADNAAAQARRIALRAPDAVAAVEFTRVTSVRELRDGSVLVANQPEGRLVLVQWGSAEAPVIGRAGDGPGEYRGVGWLYALAGDSTLFTDSYLDRWLLLDGPRIVATVVEQNTVNRLLRAQLSGADEFGHVLGVRGEVFPGRAPRTRDTADSLLLLLAGRAAQRVDTIARLKGRGGGGFHVGQRESGRPPFIVVTNPLASEDQALLFGDGWIAVARIEPYRVDWRAPDGRWVRGAPLPFTAVGVDDRERCFAMERVLGSAGGSDPSSLPGWPETVPPFLPVWLQSLAPALLAAPDGRLVIARTPTTASPEHQYDVVDRQSRLIGVISVSANETLIGFGARSVYTLSTDAQGVQRLRRHLWP
ncbi:MAG: hypothetical protein AAB409_04730 [Gemmatimonadota bacterium]